MFFPEDKARGTDYDYTFIATLKPSTLSVGCMEHPQKQEKPTYVFHCHPLRETNVTLNYLTGQS